MTGSAEARTPKVSIVMPVYNGGRYFELALQSALAQTYPNIEIVIVNDGSTDSGATDAIARRYAAENPRTVRYIHQENTGAGGALNRGVAAMTGDFFCWLSHDDLFLPEKTQVQLDFWRGLGRSDAMLISDYALIDPDGAWMHDVRFDHALFTASPRVPLFRGAVNGCTVFIPAGVIRSVEGPFDTSRKFTQDFWLWKRLIERHEFFHVPQVLVQYRIHPQQDSQRPDVAEEGENLWRAMIDATTPIQRTQLYGSSWRFFDQTHKILEPSPYKNTAAYLEARRDACIEETLVSVVIPFFNEVDLVRRALASVRAQTHRALDILLIDDGSTEPLDGLVEDLQQDGRVRLLRQANAGVSAARNTGLRHARGEYITFLDGDDQYLPEKVERQLNAMARTGALFSHTSYHVSYPGRRSGLGLLHSGRVNGDVYPVIIGGCHIATPTVMIHQAIVAAGYVFPVGLGLGEDVLTWIDIAASHRVLGIDQPLTIVEWSDRSAALNMRKSLAGYDDQLELLSAHPIHGRWRSQLGALQAARADMHRRLRSSQDCVNWDLVNNAFGREGGASALSDWCPQG